MTRTTRAGFRGHGPDAPLDLDHLAPAEVESIVGRLRDGTMPALADTISRAGNCAHPVRLVGRSETVDLRTGEVVDTFRSVDEPLGLLYKPCGSRRESVCPSCSRIYARDTFELISTGLNGGKGVPATVNANPLLFVTLTAPSFGVVHGVRDGKQPCHPRTRLVWCPHGRRLTCWARHDANDPRVGAPLCRECYDTDSATVWQWHAPELWRRFTIALRRQLAAELGVREHHARLEYAKVAEFQSRGLVHFHALVRIDGPDALVRQAKPKSDSSRRTITLSSFVVRALGEAIALELELEGGPDDLVFPTTRASPRAPSHVRDHLKQALEDVDLDVTPHDFRRTVATQVARATTLANATALLGHADEMTTVLHYVQRISVAPDLRMVIDQLVSQASEDATGSGPNDEGPHVRMIMRVGPFDWR